MTVIKPHEVIPSLKEHILVDGFDWVIDFAKSKGSHFVDARTGKRFVDFFSYFASQPLGFNHPKMDRHSHYAQELLEFGLFKPSNSDVYSAPYAEFVKTFKNSFGQDFRYFFFIEGGALAVENAMKSAQDWKVRKNLAKGKGERGFEILHFTEAFHGRSGYTMSVTNTDPLKVMYYPKFEWPRVSNPKIKFPLNEENLRDVQEREKKSLQQIAQILETKRDDIAAILIETIQSEGGDNHFRPEFLKALYDLTRKEDILLIFDEVQTGMGLTGKKWAYENFGVRPDILCFGKKAQVCGIMATERMDEVAQNVFRTSSRINSTWGGNLVDMIRSKHYINIIEQEKLVQNAQVQGEYFLKGLQKLEQKYAPSITNVRGRGLMVAFDLPTAHERNEFRKACYEEGVMVLNCGEKSIRLRPYLDVRQEDIEEGLQLIDKASQKFFRK